MIVDKIFELCNGVPHTGHHATLVNLLFEAQIEAARNNNNISKNAAILASVGNGRFTSACISAISTLGGIHAPVLEDKVGIYRDRSGIRKALKRGELIPGFGNSFYKEGIDPAFNKFYGYAEANFPDITAGIMGAREIILFETGLDIHPNAAAFTALTAEAIGLPYGLEPLLLIIPRSIVWAEVFVANRPNKPLFIP